MEGMDTLLTSRQLQDLLQVDRITIYRMLNDGRLQGFKVGGQWRFSRQAIEHWLQEQQANLAVTESPHAADDLGPTPQSLPLSCIEAIQDIFSEAMGIGTITTAVQGTPLTMISNSCEFCNLIQGTEVGWRRCINSWQEAAAGSHETPPRITMCHAGLHYVWGRIIVQGEFVAATHAGQFLLGPPGGNDWSERIADLSAAIGVSAERVHAASAGVPVLDRDRQEQISRLLQRVVATFSEIGEERLSLLRRLQRIAEITDLESVDSYVGGFGLPTRPIRQSTNSAIHQSRSDHQKET